MPGNSFSEMPRYECHKKVHALKIKEIHHNEDGSCMLVPFESGFAPLRVDPAYVAKHDPQVQGYYVVYAGGYASFSPAEAFESGYTLIN